MRDAVIVEAVRTPMGKGKAGEPCPTSTPSPFSPTRCAP